MESGNDVFIGDIFFADKVVSAYVGYAWQRQRIALTDLFWASLRDAIKKQAISVKNCFEKSQEEVAECEKKKLGFSVERLRASHGGFVLDEILRKIKNADLLFFDIANISELLDCNGTIKETARVDANGKALKRSHKGAVYLKYESFNPNVLFELGLALALGKSPYLLCPESLKEKIPSDLSNYMWTFYNTKITENVEIKLEREFVDKVGFENKLRWDFKVQANLKLKKLKK